MLAVLCIGVVLMLATLARRLARHPMETEATVAGREAEPAPAASEEGKASAPAPGKQLAPVRHDALVKTRQPAAPTTAGLESTSDGAAAPFAPAGPTSHFAADSGASSPETMVGRPRSRSESELERQNRIWFEGVTAGRAAKSDPRAPKADRAAEFYPDDWTAQILWREGFLWGGL